MFEDIIDYTREQKTFIYILNSLDEFKKMGLIEGGMFEVTQKGLDAIEGFEPTDEEIQKCMEEMRNEGMFGPVSPTCSLAKIFLEM